MSQEFQAFMDKALTQGPGDDGRLRFPESGLEEGETRDATVWVLFQPYKPKNVYRVIGVSVTGDARLRGEVPKIKVRAGDVFEIPIVWIGRHQVITDLQNLEGEIEVEGVVESHG